MNSCCTLLFFATFLLLPKAIPAQGLVGRFAFTPRVGLVVPTGDFGSSEIFPSTYGLAFLGACAGLAGEYYVTNDYALGINMRYSYFTRNVSVIPALVGQDIDPYWRIVELGPFVRYIASHGEHTRVFACLGAHLGKVDGTADIFRDGKEVRADADFSPALALDFSLGVLGKLSETTALSGEIGITHLLTSGKSARLAASGKKFTDNVDLNMDWFGFRAGVVFFLGNQR